MPKKTSFDWETNSGFVDKLALLSRKDEGALARLLLTGRAQCKFIDHAHSMAQRSRILSYDDMLLFLMLTIWQAARSTERSLRWDEDKGVPFAAWVLRLWNHRMLVELQVERAKKRKPPGGIISLERLMERTEIFELGSMNLSSKSVMDYSPSLRQRDPDKVKEISVEIFLRDVEEQRGKEAREMCELILEGFTRADIAEIFYPDVWYQARWQRIDLFFQSLVPIAEEAEFTLD